MPQKNDAVTAMSGVFSNERVNQSKRLVINEPLSVEVPL
jgi:hypothetical protein